MWDSAGVSTIDPVSCAAIPFMAFADAIEEYEADSGTDDEGDNAQFVVKQDCLKITFFYI